MPRFLIEAPHGSDVVACSHAVKIFLASGSHFLTHADWGCKDGDHNARIIADFDSKDRARAIVAPAYRRDAKIVQLNKFTMAEIDELLRYHGG